MSESGRFWLGVVLFLLACLRLMYGIWGWAFTPAEQYSGVLTPERMVWGWIHDRLERFRASWVAAIKRMKAARRQAEAQRLLLAATQASKQEEEPKEPQPSKLVACPDCGASISPRAPVCPQCGAPLSSRSDLTVAYLENQRRNRRGDTQACGCLLMVLGLVCCCLAPPIAGVLLLVGLIVLIVGLCL
jgi:hypothetical protein